MKKQYCDTSYPDRYFIACIKEGEGGAPAGRGGRLV